MKFRPLALLLLVSLATQGQSPEVVVGRALNANEMRQQLSLPPVKFRLFRPSSMSYTTTTFFDTKKKKAYQGVGFEGKSFQVAVMDDYIKYNGFKKLTAEFATEKEGQEVGIVGFVKLNDKSFVFYTITYIATDEFSLYVNEMSDDLVLLGSPILVHNFKELILRGTSVSITSSENKQFFLITRILNTSPKEKQKFECKAINDSFGEVWVKAFELPYLDKEVALQASDIDDGGNLYFMAEAGKKSSKRPLLYTYFWKSKSFKESKLGLAEGLNYGFNLEIKQGTSYLTGLNLNKKTISCVFAKMNPVTETVETASSNVLPPEFVKVAGKGLYSPEDWNVTNLIALTNDDLVASVESPIFHTYRGSQLIASFSYSTLLISFKPDGKMNWSHIVRKEQNGYFDFVLGNLVLPNHDKTLVIYNDNPSNIKKDAKDAHIDTYGLKKSMVVVQEIDASGKVKKYALDTRDLENYCILISSTQIIEKGLYSVAFSNYAKPLHPLTRPGTLQLK